MRDSDQFGNYSTELINDYYTSFRKRVFTLLFVGYSRVREQKNDLSQSIEDNITARIVQCIEDFLKEKNSPAWVDHFQVKEQHPHAPHGEIGNRRKWLDIFIQGNRKENNSNFCFETKRLNNHKKPDDYFGMEGVQRFLSATYPINAQGEAAMIGYMQSESIPYWEKWLKNNSISSFESYSVIPELENIFRTCHQKQAGTCVILFHVLLDFLPLR